jgi:hypothetical protein
MALIKVINSPKFNVMNLLPPSFLTWLSRLYYRVYRPECYLFEGRETGRYLHVAIDINGKVEDLISG